MITLPSFLWCLLLGVLLRNGAQLLGIRFNDEAIGLISTICASPNTMAPTRSPSEVTR